MIADLKSIRITNKPSNSAFFVKGEEIIFDVEFDKPVKVQKLHIWESSEDRHKKLLIPKVPISEIPIPNLRFSIAGKPLIANYTEGSGQSTLRFNYRVDQHFAEGSFISIPENALFAKTSSIGYKPPIRWKSQATDLTSAQVWSISLELAGDTGHLFDRVTSNNVINVKGLSDSKLWQYSIDFGNSWLKGINSSFVVPDGFYQTGRVNVRSFSTKSGTSRPNASSLEKFTIDRKPPSAPFIDLAIDTGIKPDDRNTKNNVIKISGLEESLLS